MSLQAYKRLDLAANQLRTAIDLFLSRPSRDNFSVVTLAGAADIIFAELVSRRKKENFTDHFIKEKNDTRKLGEIGKEINDTLFINDLKHMDPGEDGHIEMDVYECAIAAILKAISNYNMLEEKDSKLISKFLIWVRTNLDPKKYNIFCDPNWKSPDGP